MERGWTLLSVGMGAGLMFLLDPDRGRRRRALVRDQAVRLSHRGRRAVALGSRDLLNRSRGVVADVRHKLTGAATDDDVLAERVRARIGHVVAHPHAIRVEVAAGHVTLRGAILEDELASCIAACDAVPGVRTVECALDIHAVASIPELMGGHRRAAERSAGHPTPASQFATALSGVACTLWGTRRGGILGFAVRGAGVAILLSELAGTETIRELLADLRPRLAAWTGGSPLPSRSLRALAGDEEP